MHHRKRSTIQIVATGPEGFEPPTTWLKARRSTELSYEPHPLKMYSIIKMSEDYINIPHMAGFHASAITPLSRTGR